MNVTASKSKTLGVLCLAAAVVTAFWMSTGCTHPSGVNTGTGQASEDTDSSPSSKLPSSTSKGSGADKVPSQKNPKDPGNQVDPDCLGEDALDDPDCICAAGESEPCARGGKGDCALGRRSCIEGRWGVCVARFPVMAKESCAEPRSDEFGEALGDENCDGRVNETAVNGVEPEGCQVYMIDEDKDGWGAVGPDYRSGLSDYSYGCFCEGNVPSARLVPAREGRENKDCGDCPDDGDLVNPGVRNFHEYPSSCLTELNWAGGAYDFDCNGHQELAYPTAGQCVQQDGGCVEQPGHWNAEIPDCGEQGWHMSWCMSSAPPCEVMNGHYPDVQACR